MEYKKKTSALIDISIALSVVLMLTLLWNGYFGWLGLMIIPVFGLFLLNRDK